jgi:hypothetical protein
VREGETVLLRRSGRGSTRRVKLLELSLSHLIVSSTDLPADGESVSVTIELRDRHIEMEIPATVGWHRGSEFTVVFDYLTLRQTYGLTLALELARQAAEVVSPAIARTARR